jgi:hypothetical protein
MNQRMMSRVNQRQQSNVFGFRNNGTSELNGELKAPNDNQAKAILEKIAMLSTQNTFKSQTM